MGLERNRQIGYYIIGSSLGRLLIGATSKGLCSLMWGDHDQELRDALARLFPRDILSGSLENPAAWSKPLNQYLGGKPVDLDFSLDVQGTPFQQTVWRQIRAIPVGRTLSYGNLAIALGNPGGTRAVAGACASNPVALVIPCHRVIRSDGGLGGYRWGLQRKRKLLSLETTMAGSGSWRLTSPSEPARPNSSPLHSPPARECGPEEESLDL